MRTLQLFALAALFCGISASADTIELKTGERIEGAFKQATAAGAVIEVGGQAITIPLVKVKAIYFGAAPSASPSAASPVRDALDALRGLQSVVESGLTYRDYATRVLDAKVKVDRYLASSPNDPPELRKSIGLSMREYELAGQAWSLQDLKWTSLITPDLVERCPAAGKIIPANEQKAKLVGAFVGLQMRDDALEELRVDGQDPHKVFWKCAITEGAEAERLLSRR